MTEGRIDTWAIVELFGHTKIAGMVTEATIAGGAFLRVDVPETKHAAAWTRFVGPGAVYAINPVAEDVARHMAEQIDARPVQPWEMPRPKVPQLQQDAHDILFASDSTSLPPPHLFLRDRDESDVCAECGEGSDWDGHGEPVLDHVFAADPEQSTTDCGTCGEHRLRHTTQAAIDAWGFDDLDEDTDNRDLEDVLESGLDQGEEE